MINEAAHTATLTLKQTGLRGPITFDLSHTSNPGEHYYEGYMLAGMLAAKWFEVKALLNIDDTAEADGVEYTASFAIGQQSEGSDLYFKLNMEPKLPHDATEFPESFQAISHLATVALYEVGILDEEGNVLDDDGLDLIDITATQKSHSLH